ncbi:hypothetical protein Tco_0679971 [Tanacetum coccineum]|uniref:Uncharacterized protein n=1 Tax=Tanacetum coccineum TaxID=301880 RepID=A0ABQ4XK05_9ASTR
MEYLPQRRWSSLEKKRAHIMIKAIEKQLKERRMMRSLEKFVSGRHSLENYTSESLSSLLTQTSQENTRSISFMKWTISVCRETVCMQTITPNNFPRPTLSEHPPPNSLHRTALIFESIEYSKLSREEI